MSEDDKERLCFHCMIVELIEQFFDEYPASETDTIDTDELITAAAKTIAELTCSESGTIRQQTIEKLMREIMEHDAEFRQEDTVGATGSAARH